MKMASIDVEKLISELTLMEKVALTAGKIPAPENGEALSSFLHALVHF